MYGKGGREGENEMGGNGDKLGRREGRMKDQKWGKIKLGKKNQEGRSVREGEMG